MNKIVIFSAMISMVMVAQGQDKEPTQIQPPGHEILLFDIEQNTHGVLALSVGKNITGRIGYDNQPKFSDLGGLLYYTRAVSSGDGMQMDIYQYDVATGQTQAYMQTTRSEYSATPMRNSPNLSVVQVDENGDQYVVILNQSAAADQQFRRTSDLKQVGYFNWTADGGLWSFVLNDEGGGDLYLQKQGVQAAKLTANIGRALVTDSTGMYLYYVDKNTQPWRIHKRNSAGSFEDVMPLPMGVEDFTVDSAGRFWAGRGNTLYVSTDQKRWFIITEFDDPELDQITRLTTNPQADKIAVVFAERSTQ